MQLKKPAARNLLLIATLGAYLLPYLSYADIQTLKASASRPTIADVLKELGPAPIRYASATSAIPSLPALAQAIAGMEAAFPGAIWAPLGRDSARLGDLMDAFYISIGQPGRVARLNASGTSIRGATAAELVKLMESAGMNLRDLKGSRPFVMMDATNYGSASQSTTLLTAAYAAFKSAGGKTADLIDHVNFINLKPGQMYGQNIVSPGFDFRSFMTQVKASSNAYPTAILSFPLDNWTYGTEWHGNFGAIGPQANGKFEAPPGGRGGDVVTTAALAEMVDAINQLGTPEFHALVVQAAKGYNFEFPLDPAAVKRAGEEREKIEAARNAELASRFSDKLKRELPDLVSKLPVRTAPAPGAATVEEAYLSDSAKQLHQWLEGALADFAGAREASKAIREAGVNSVTLNFINQATLALKTNKIRVRDYRRLLGFALSSSEDNAHFLAAIQAIFRNEPEFEKQLVEKGDYFLTTYAEKKRPGTEHTSAVYWKIQKHIGFVRRVETTPAAVRTVK